VGFGIDGGRGWLWELLGHEPRFREKRGIKRVHKIGLKYLFQESPFGAKLKCDVFLIMYLISVVSYISGPGVIICLILENHGLTS